MSDPAASDYVAQQPNRATKRRKWSRWLLIAGVLYCALCLVFWGMAQADYSRVLSGRKPLFAYYYSGVADGGSKEYHAPACAYRLYVLHAYAYPRPAWGGGDAWGYDDGVILDYYLPPLFLLSKRSLRVVPGEVPDQRRAIFLEVESWTRIRFYNAEPEGVPRPKPCSKAEAERYIADVRHRLLPSAQVMLAEDLDLGGKGRQADMDEIQAWLVGQGITSGTFRVAGDYETIVVRQFGEDGAKPKRNGDNQ